MKIAVNTRLLLKGKLEGIGWFSFEILKRITQAHPEHQFLFIFDRPFDSKFIFADNIETVVVGPQARHPFLYILWFEISVNRILKKHKADLYLSPDSFLSLCSKVPSVAVIHDLNFEYYPKDIPFFARVYNKIMFPHFAKKADRIATVSENSKKDIEKLYNIPSNRIDVVYNAAKEIFSPSTAAEAKETKTKYTFGNDYFLYVGALNPRKNLVNLFKAYDLFCDAEGKDIKLAVVGSKMYWTKDIEATYKSMKHQDGVIFLGHLGSSDLNSVYGAAVALTYVSYFEGFGIPIVEAFGSHCPVITSNVTSMPEVAGDAALLIDPFKPDDIFQAMQKIATSDDLRRQLIEKGIKQLSRFSWDISAEKMWQTIQKVSKKHQLQ